MANAKFPSPSINRLIENDPMIVKVDLDRGENAGMRSSSLPKNVKNSMTISHTAGKDMGPGRTSGGDV